MNKIQEVLEKNKQKNKKSFIGYLTAGDPSLESMTSLIQAMVKGGCDIVEVGVPFSDPLADGPVIQAAGQRAINNGTNIYKIFEILEKQRSSIKVPIAFLVYFNTLIVYGVEKFIKRCEQIGIDGLIIPDLPYEEQGELEGIINQEKVALIPFASPTSKQRMEYTIKKGSGFVYTVSSMGVTGRNSSFYYNLESYLKEVRSYATIPMAVGFGISSKEDVKKIEPYCDAVIVGTAIVKKIHETNGDANKLERFIKSLKG